MNTPLRRAGMARVLKRSHSFTCTPRVHPLTEWTIPAFAFPAEAAGTHLPCSAAFSMACGDLTGIRGDLVSGSSASTITGKARDAISFKHWPRNHDLPPGLWSRSQRLGLETGSRRTNVSSRSRLEKNCQCLGLVSVSGGRCLGLVSSRSRPFTSRAQDQFSAKLCRPQYVVWTGFRRCKPML